MTVKTNPIKATTLTTGNHTTLKWQKVRNRSIGFLVALGPLAICAYVMVSWVLGGSRIFESGSLFLQSSWGTALLLFITVCGVLHGVATCSINNVLGGIAIVALLHFMPQGSGIAALAVCATLLISLNQAKRVYEKLQTKSCEMLSIETRNELNSRCEACHTQSVSPYQPGGIADRYVSKSELSNTAVTKIILYRIR